MFDILITVNSPGELYGLAKPTIEKIKLKHEDARIILVIPPCQYSSGREAEIARTFPEIFEVILPQEYTKWILKGIPPRGITFSKQGIVVFMGGDLLHAVLLSRKVHFPAITYTCDKIGWSRSFKRFLVPDSRMYKKAIQKGIKLEKLKIVGEIIVDAAKPRMSKEESLKFWRIDPNKPIVTLFPGSREFQYKYMTSFLIKTAELIKDKIPDIQFIFSLSPFVSIYALQNYMNPKTDEEKIYKENTNLPCRIIKEDLYHTYIVNEKGLKILTVEGAQYDILNISDILITVPGTNTAEAAALGTPIISTLPLNKPEILPLEGLPEILSKIPGIGNYIKILAIKLLSKMIKYFALPNIKAEQEVVPELIGKLEPSEVAKTAIKLLNNPKLRVEMGLKLKEIMGKEGATEKIAEEIYEAISKTYKIS